MKNLFLALILSFSTALLAQEVIPSGIILPVRLNNTLKSDKAHAGQKISGRVMQDVPLNDHTKIKAGAKVLGQVVAATPGNDTRGGDVTLRFDTLVVGSHHIPITSNLRAAATMMDVEAALVPDSGPDRGSPDNFWVTNQIGGETDYHDSEVTHGSTVVGRSVPNGVLVRISGPPGTKCRGQSPDDKRQQALWLFSSDACGLYGFPGLSLVHAGRSNPVGDIQIAAETGNLTLPSGSGMLIRVQKVGQN